MYVSQRRYEEMPSSGEAMSRCLGRVLLCSCLLCAVIHSRKSVNAHTSTLVSSRLATYDERNHQS